MSDTDAKYFRTQRDPTQLCHRSACLIASTLSVMAACTRGATGPAISLDGFRAQQEDKVGGIDLYDAKVAARHFGVELEVRADFAPGAEYPRDERDELRDHGSTTPAGVIGLLTAGRFVVMNISYAALPDEYHRARYEGPHGIGLLGVRAEDTAHVEILVADPLDDRARWLPAEPFFAAAKAINGHGRIDCAATPVREPVSWTLHFAPRALVRLAVLSPAGCIASWDDRPWGVRGSSAPCREPERKPGCVSGSARVALVTKGVFAGRWVRIDAGDGITVSSS